MPFDLDAAIAKVPDYPKPGILFYDITSVLMQPEAFSYCLETLTARYAREDLGAIAAVESRGFIFGAPLAQSLGLPLLLVRKAGKLPGDTVSRSYELEYGTDTIEIHRRDLLGSGPILIVDDLIATGGTVAAAAELMESQGEAVAGICGVIGLPFLNYQERLAGRTVYTLIEYDSE